MPDELEMAAVALGAAASRFLVALARSVSAGRAADLSIADAVVRLAGLVAVEARPAVRPAGEGWTCLASGCGRSFPSRADRAAHAAAEHPPESWTCPTCDKTFTSVQALSAHGRAHKDLGLVCVCGEQFRTRQGLGSHRLGCALSHDPGAPPAAPAPRPAPPSPPAPRPAPPSPSPPAAASPAPPPAVRPVKDPGAGYRCDDCHTGFRTRGALRGHPCPVRGADRVGPRIHPTRPDGKVECPAGCGRLFSASAAAGAHGRICDGSGAPAAPLGPVVLACESCAYTTTSLASGLLASHTADAHRRAPTRSERTPRPALSATA